MKKNNLILTYDLGTTGNKCTIFDETGQELYSINIPYPTYYPRPGWAEQDPADFWMSVVQGTKMLMETHGLNASEIAVIGLCGHMNGCIPVDASGNVLYRNIIHSDSRSASACDHIARRIPFQDFYQITGNRLDAHYTLPKILWLMENYPDIYYRTRFFINTKDYIAYRLTDVPGVTDYSDASLTCMLDMSRRDWALDMLKDIGFDTNKLPRLMRSIDLAGTLTKQAADALGLVAGVPIAVGGGDGACASRGAGMTKPGTAYNYLGSSAWISTLSPKPVYDADARIFNYFDLDGVHSNVCGTVQSAAASFNWAVDMLASPGLESAGKVMEEKERYAWVEKAARLSPPGANGVFFLPYLMGERTPLWDGNTRGAFVGFTLYHNKSDMLRAVYEGVGFALKSVLDVFTENKIAIEELTLIGGGAKSMLWNEILCALFRIPLKVHKVPGEATSLGAAMAAGVSVGIFKDLVHAAKIEYARAYYPEEKMMQAYETPYRIYRSLYPRLKPVYEDITDSYNMIGEIK